MLLIYVIAQAKLHILESRMQRLAEAEAWCRNWRDLLLNHRDLWVLAQIYKQFWPGVGELSDDDGVKHGFRTTVLWGSQSVLVHLLFSLAC